MSVLRIGDVRLYYEVQPPDDNGTDPQRPTLVFLHDGLGAVPSWEEMPARFARRLGTRALTYDRPGYGRSSPCTKFPPDFLEQEVERLERLRAALALSRIVPVGHSDGGSIALLYAAAYPHCVSALVTIAAHTFVEPETRAGIAELVRRRARRDEPGALERLHGDRADAVLAAWSGRWLDEGHAGWDIRPHMEAISAPLLVVQGEDDPFGTRAQVDTIVQYAPRAEAWLLPRCGHAPQHDRPDAFLERVAGFLAPHLR